MNLVSIQNMTINIAGSQKGSQLVLDIPMTHPQFIRGYQGALASKEHRTETFTDQDIVNLLRDMVQEPAEFQNEDILQYHAGSLVGLIVAKCKGAQ